MRVLMLSKALVVGPAQTKAEELARIPGVELLVVVPPVWQEPRGTPQRLERQHTVGYDLHVAPMHFNGRYHFHYYPTIGRIVRRFRPDIFHIDEEPYNFATWHAMGAGKRVGAKMCFFTWQNIPKRYPPPFAQMEQAVYAGTDAGIAGNQAALEILRDKGFTKPVAVIPQFGVDPDIYSPPPPTPRPANWTPVIGYIGRLVEEKGVQTLLDAAALLRRPYRVEIVGAGPYRADLETAASRLGVRDRIAFRNSVAARDIPGVLANFDLLVVPSLTRANWMEQFGRVIIEAMACGVPVIGSDSGEIPHVIGDAGTVVPEDRPEELALRIHDLLEDGALRADHAARGRQRVLKMYTQRQIAQRTYRVYRAMLHGDGPNALSPPPAPRAGPPPKPDAPRGGGGEDRRVSPPAPRPAPSPPPQEGGAARDSLRGPERGASREPARGPERGAPRRVRLRPVSTSPVSPVSLAPHENRADDAGVEPEYPPGYARSAPLTPAPQAEPPHVAPPPRDVAAPGDMREARPEPPASPDWWTKRDVPSGRRPTRSWFHEK